MKQDEISRPRGHEVDLTIVAPVYNEAANIRELSRRVRAVLGDVSRRLGLVGEFLLVDDGSTDGSCAMAAAESANDSRVRLLPLGQNRGQFAALMAGLAASRGEYVITLDADLQNPPEEIPRLLAAMRSGHDLVTTIRSRRRDSTFRRHASRLSNRLSTWIAGCSVRDHGCMLCGYHAALVDVMCRRRFGLRFISALSRLHAKNPAEVEVAHAERACGRSRYTFGRLVKLQLDAVVSFARMRRLARRLKRSGASRTAVPSSIEAGGGAADAKFTN